MLLIGVAVARTLGAALLMALAASIEPVGQGSALQRDERGSTPSVHFCRRSSSTRSMCLVISLVAPAFELLRSLPAKKYGSSSFVLDPVPSEKALIVRQTQP